MSGPRHRFASGGLAGARRLRGLACAVALSLLGGCSADNAMFRADWNWWSRGSTPAPAKVAGDDLVGADGACAPATTPPRGVALGMSECELVRLVGSVPQVAIRANERGERVATLTFAEGERAGIYEFTAGALVTIDRLPEQPKTARAPRKKPAPKRAQSRSQSTTQAQ